MSLDLKMKILVVDDSGTMRLMFKQYLAKGGFENVITANDGKEALSVLEQNQDVALIISDWNMPVMDGLDFLKAVRSSDTLGKIPFIMATAQGDKGQQARVMEFGGNDHIAKPFDTKELKKKIEGIFRAEREQPAPSKKERRVVDGKVVVKLGHIQITDHLALGVLKHMIETGEVSPRHFVLETERMAGWNPIQENLEKGDIDGAFVLAPIAMDLYAYDVPIKLVLLAHKNGSGFVRNKNYENDPTNSLKDFYKYKVINIPHKMSIHNMLAHKFLTRLELKPGVPGKKAINVRFEVVPPIKMPGIMKENEDVAGFIVAEPICTKASTNGIGELEFVSGMMWPNHPCCVLSLRDELIEAHPDAVFELTSLIVKAGKFIESNKEKAAEIAVAFLDPDKTLGLTTKVLEKVLNQPGGITMNDLYPIKADLERIQQYMHSEMGIGKLIDLDKFVDLRFADAACKS